MLGSKSLRDERVFVHRNSYVEGGTAYMNGSDRHLVVNSGSDGGFNFHTSTRDP